MEFLEQVKYDQSNNKASPMSRPTSKTKQSLKIEKHSIKQP